MIKTRAYTSLVRPIVQYASTAWSPHTLKDITSIESIQRRAARFVFNDYSRSSSVSSMLDELNWPLLRERRIANDLTMFYKINHALVNIPLPSEITPRFPNIKQSVKRFKFHALTFLS